MKLLLIASIVLLCSCTAQQQLNRAKRLIMLAEAKGATWTRDTLMVERTITTPGIEADTVVSFDGTFGVSDLGQNSLPQTFAIDPGDTNTVTLDKGGLKATALVKWRTKTVHLKAECAPDTVRVSVPVAVTNTIECPPCKWTWWKIVASCIIALLIGCLIGRFLWMRG